MHNLKTDTAIAEQGIWVAIGENADGSKPGFLLSRMSKQNKKYRVALKEKLNKLETNGAVDLESVSDKEADDIMLDVFCSEVLLDWRNIQPENDGKAIAFNKENAMKLLGNPDWVDLYDKLNSIAHKATNFKSKRVEAEIKN